MRKLIEIPLLRRMFGIAHFNFGAKSRNGQDVAQCYADAMKWYRLAANQRNADAQNNLGVMHEQGRGVAQDYAEAVKWFQLAANQGLAEAQNNLGVMYAQGQGVVQDYVEAHRWFTLASASGNENAETNRASIESKMAREEIAEAQQRAAAWKAPQ